MMKPLPKMMLASLGLALSGTAQAQEIGELTQVVIEPQLARSDVAGTRSEPGFAPQPIIAGPLILTPSLSVTGGYDSNVFNRAGGAGDAVATITPRLGLRTNSPRHMLRIDAMGHLRRFASEGTENSEEFDLRGLVRFDLAERQGFTLGGGYGQRIEPRSSVGDIANAAEPVSFGQLRGEMGFDLAFGRLSLRSSAHYEERDHDDLALLSGGDLDLSFRDTRQWGADLALGYAVSGLVSVFGRAAYGEVESTNPAPNAARDADDLALLLGIRGELSPLVSAELALGYRQRDFALARFADFEGLTYRADLQWFVTPLLTLRLQAGQEFLNSGIAQVAGILSNRVVLSAYYDVLRNLRLAAIAAYEHNDYRETNTSANRPSLRLQAQYRLGPQLALGAFAGVQNQDVNGPALVQPFTSFSTGIGITLTP